MSVPARLAAAAPLLSIAVCTLLIAACAVGPAKPDIRSPEEIVARANGTTLSSGNNLVQGISFALSPVGEKCRQQSGQLVQDKAVSVSFVDRRRAQSDRILQVPARMVCKAEVGEPWGVTIDLQNPRYLIGPSVGDGVFYYADLRTSYVPGDVIATEQRLARRREAEDKSSMESQLHECAKLRADYLQRLRNHPQPGMKVALGMIVEVKGNIALIQYDAFGRQMKGKDTEWTAVSTLGPGEDCPR